MSWFYNHSGFSSTVLLFPPLIMCALCKLSSFFLQSAVTQSRALVLTTTVNMTWKAPMYGLTNVAFWYVLTLIVILAATFMLALWVLSKGCPECQQSSCTVLGMLYRIAGKFCKVYSWDFAIWSNWCIRMLLVNWCIVEFDSGFASNQDWRLPLFMCIDSFVCLLCS